MNLQEAIQVEKNRAASQVAQIKEQNVVDQEQLDKLKEQYYAAIVKGTEKDMDHLNVLIKEVSGRITKRNEMITALEDKNNPIIRSLVAEALESAMTEISILTEQAQLKVKELEPIRQELLQGLQDLNANRQREDTLRDFINGYHHHLSADVKEKIGIASHGIGHTSSTSRMISNLIIKEGQVYKRP